MIEEYENEQERLFNPCIVYSHDVKSIKIARESVGFSYENFEKDTLSEINWLSRELKSSSAVNNKPRSYSRMSRHDTFPADKDLLSNESKLSFVVPPDVHYPFHIRYRENVGSKKGEWKDPLSYKDGVFFSPKLKLENSKYGIPPPLILSKSWERNHIKPCEKALLNHIEDNSIIQRVYTISGLTPSVEKSDSWAGWVLGTASKGLYGERTVEVQFASEVLEKSRINGSTYKIIRKFSEVNDEDWNTLPTLQYKIPTVDILSSSLTLTLTWFKTTGVKQLENLFLGQLIENRNKNSLIIQNFVKEVLIKLKPLWEESVRPYLDNDANLQYLLKERRDIKIRESSLNFIRYLKDMKLITNVPENISTIKPDIIAVDLRAVKTEDDDPKKQLSLSKLNRVIKLETKSGVLRYEVDPGTSIKLTILAAFSKEARKRRRFDESTTFRTGMKIWYTIFNKDTKRYLDLEDDDMIQDVASFVKGTSKRIRKKHFLQRSEIILNGKDKYGNNLLSHGQTIEVKVFVEEYGAHEDEVKVIKLKYRSSKEEDLLENPSLENNKNIKNDFKSIETDFDDPSENENAIRRSYLKIISLPKTRQEVENVFRDLDAELNSQDNEPTDTVNNDSETRLIVKPVVEIEAGVRTYDKQFFLQLMSRLGHQLSSFDVYQIQHKLASPRSFSHEIEASNEFEFTREEFLQFYVRSKYNNSIFNLVLNELKETLLRKKYKFFQSYLKVSSKDIQVIKQKRLEQRAKAGVKGNISATDVSFSSLFSLPEREILKKYLNNTLKQYTSEFYVSYKNKPLSFTRKKQKNVLGFQESLDASGSFKKNDKKALNDDKSQENLETGNITSEKRDEYQVESVLKEVRAFTTKMLITFLGRNLPESCFQTESYRSMFRTKSYSFSISSKPSETLLALRENSDERNNNKRIDWIEQKVKHLLDENDQSTSEKSKASNEKPEADKATLEDTLKESFMWFIIGFFREYKINRDSLRVESDKLKEIKRREKEKKQEKLREVLNNGTVDIDVESKILDEFDSNEIFSFIVKEVVKTEIDDVIRDIVPRVSKAISEKVIPAIVSGIFQGAKSLLWNNKFRIFFGITGIAACITVIREPQQSKLTFFAFVKEASGLVQATKVKLKA